MDPRYWRPATAAAVTLLVVIAVLDDRWVSNPVLSLTFAVAAVAVGRRRRSTRADRRRPWSWLFGGVAVLAVTTPLDQLSVSVPELGRLAPVIGALFLGGYGGMAVAVHGFARLRTARRDREATIDAVIVGITMGTALLNSIGSLLHQGGTSQWLSPIVMFGLTVVGASVAALGARLLLTSRPVPSAWLFAAASVGSMIATAASMIVTLNGGIIGATTWVMAILVASGWSLTIGALHPSATALTAPDGHASTSATANARLAVLGVAAMATPLIAAWTAATGNVWIGAGPALLVTALILWRLVSLVGDREAARRLAGERERQQRAIADLGLAAMRDDDLDALLTTAADRTRTVLGARTVEIVENRGSQGPRRVAVAADGPVVASVTRGSVFDRLEPGAVRLRLGGGTPHTVVPDQDRDLPPATVVEVGLGTANARWGQLRAERDRPFDAAAVRFLMALASVVGAALEHRLAAANLRHQALHDQLTGLPNRSLLADRLDHALRAAARGRRELAVMFLDLDGFKGVNDALGHDAGDELLVAVAGRLRAELRDADTLARFAGDEFVVVSGDVDGEDGALRLADRMIERLAEPFDLSSGTGSVGVSIGVVVTGGVGVTAEGLLRSADAAMYRAKRAGKGRAVLVSAGDLAASA